MGSPPASGIEQFSHLFLTLENPDDRRHIKRHPCDDTEELLAFFGLERHPFLEDPDPALPLDIRRHETVFLRLKQGIEDGAPLCMLTAPAGMGKMLVLRRLTHNLPPDRYRTTEVMIEKGMTGGAFLRNLLYGLGLTDIHKEKASLHDLILLLRHLMITSYRKDGIRFVPLVIEAQFMGPDLWELLRVLSTIETGSAKVATIVLAGDKALDKKLRGKDFAAHATRIFIREKLTPLTAVETERYLEGRLARANFSGRLFHPGSYHAICKAAAGILRDIDTLAHNALIEAFKK